MENPEVGFAGGEAAAAAAERFASPPAFQDYPRDKEPNGGNEDDVSPEKDMFATHDNARENGAPEERPPAQLLEFDSLLSGGKNDVSSSGDERLLLEESLTESTGGNVDKVDDETIETGVLSDTTLGEVEVNREPKSNVETKEKAGEDEMELFDGYKKTVQDDNDMTREEGDNTEDKKELDDDDSKKEAGDDDGSKQDEEDKGEKSKTAGEDVDANGDEENETDKKSKEPSDEEYFASLPQEEMEWYKELGPTVESLHNKVITCNTCHRQITNTPGNFAHRHPYLGITICRPCRLFYGDGEWTKDADGMDEFCRWCANGGDLLLCDKCTHSFCKRCIQRNLGRNTLSSIMKAEEWKCLICDPKQIYKFRATYHAVSQMVQSQRQKQKKDEGKKKTVIPQQKTKSQKDLETSVVENPENFIDENISSAFKSLELYKKALDDERKRWLRQNKQMEPGLASNICKSLRRIYATTKKNMDLLDAALVQSFESEFPDEEADRIRIGNVTSQSPMIPESLKRKATSPSKSAPAAKRKRKRPSTAKTIQLNGKAETGEFDPSSMLEVQLKTRRSPAKKKLRAIAAKKVKSSGNKVSTTLFKKKKQDGSKKKPIKIDNDDSDIEMVEETITKPSIMKKPGPKSRTMKT